MVNATEMAKPLKRLDCNACGLELNATASSRGRTIDETA